MKALSIMQPWAWLIVNGYKDIENRDWKPTNPGLRFRGPVLIHAGRTFDGDDDPADWGWPRNERPCEFDQGGIVGEAEIVDCVTRSGSRWFFGPYGFVLRNARPLPFRPCVGALGFFEPDYAKRYVVKNKPAPTGKAKPAPRQLPLI